jgi:phage protein D
MVTETAQPDFSVIINGATELIKERVISIKTADEAGIMSDSCEIELDNFDDAFALPKTEAVISVSLGYKETELTKIGSYYVKEIIVDGVRKTLKIKANAASKAMRSQKSKSHEGSVNELISEPADEFDLDPAVSADLEDLNLEDHPQFAESDMNYLTRMSQRIGAVAKPSDGHLIFTGDTGAKSASGKPLPTKYVDASEIREYSCSFKETESGGGGGAVGSVFASWYDKEKGEYFMVKVGSGDPEYELDEIFSSEKEALAATNAKFRRIVKSNKTFSFTTGGRPDFFAESPVILRGFGTKIPTDWIISRVEHSLSSSGFTTQVECAGLV